MTMNLFGKKSSQNDTNYKSRLEYKLYLAREDPEPVFDLSDCNLKNVPSGVYSLCKVFRKERLLLQVNQLSSLSGGGQLSDLYLLTNLDLHKNHLSALPEEIGHLTNLQVLDVSFNDLKKLPEAIGFLAKLEILNCSHNKLRSLPSTIGQLVCLTTLDLRVNSNLSFLPPSLNQASSLQHLLVDEGTLRDLPTVITRQGTHTMVNLISKQDNPSEMIRKENVPADVLSYTKGSPCATEECHQLQDSLKLLEKKKEDKQKEFMDIEKVLFQQKDNEYRKHESIKQDKDKLILDLKEQQKKLEEDVSRFQSKKEQERAKLLNHLLEVEKQSEERIEDLISLNQALRQSSHWQEQELQDQRMLQEYKDKRHELRHQEIIDAMESLLAEECSRKDKFMEYEKAKSEVIQHSLLREVEWKEQMSWLLNARDAHQTALMSAVETDIEVQKALVATLLEKSDLRSQSLVMQVALIEHQLAVLTDVELQRRKVDSAQQLNDLAEKRKTLSELLVELLKEQQERRRHLTNRIQELESESQSCGRSTDYWLQQYQRLLDLRPAQLRTSLDPELVHEMVRKDVAHCLPFLACCDIHSVTQTQLALIGVTNEQDQLAIMKAVNTYLTHKQAELAPSAPPPADLPSAPPIESLSECVVCMEAQCDVVFVPCGHLCTCTSCAFQLLLCPLCRASLQRKIRVFIQ